ncbi:Ig-like domain-containing protein [Microbacterium sp. GXF7504]
MSDRSILRSVAAVAIALIAAAASVLGFALPAHAAAYDHPGAVDPASVVVSGGAVVNVGDRLRIDASWSVPDDAVAGQTFGMTLPAEFDRYTQTFSLPAADDPSQTVATCAVAGTPAVLTCTLTNYVDGRTGVGGSLWFQVTAGAATTESSVLFEIDGELVAVDLPSPGIEEPGTGGVDPLPTSSYKYGWQTAEGSLGWGIVFPGSALVGQGTATVSDTLAPADADTQAHRNTDGWIGVYSRVEGSNDWLPVSGWTGGWNADGTGFELTLPGPFTADRAYWVYYFTSPVEAVYADDVFENVATVAGTALHAEKTWVATGGGDGSGAMLGRFSIEKALVDEGALVPDDTVFTVVYTIGADPARHTMALAPGAPAEFSVRAAGGTAYTIEEIDLPAIDGVDWGVPAYSGAGVTDLGDGRAQVVPAAGETVAVVLTNTATATPVEPDPPVTPAVTEPQTPVTPISAPTPAAPTSGSGDLAATGGDGPNLAVLALVIAGPLGLALLVASRFRRVRGDGR